jgi:SOS-response transcriptional repressor LexA
MKTAQDIRHENLLTLLRDVGTLAEIARQCEISEAYLSQIKNRSKESKTGTPRTMGDKIARKIEKGLGLNFGWMDADHSNELVEATRLQLEDIWAEYRAAVDTCDIPIIDIASLATFDFKTQHTGDEVCRRTHTTTNHSRSTAAIALNDRAMEPEFLNNDLVIIDTELKPEAGDLVVATVKPNLTFFRKYKPTTLSLKKTNQFSLTPINQDYPAIHSIEHDITIIGVMIEHRRLRRTS